MYCDVRDFAPIIGEAKDRMPHRETILNRRRGSPRRTQRWFQAGHKRYPTDENDGGLIGSLGMPLVF